MLRISTEELFEKTMEEIKKDTANKKKAKKAPKIEENLLHATLEDDFNYQIRDRGEEYYNCGNVKHVYKTGNKYTASVSGSGDKEYDVEITVDDQDLAEYECSCPCEFNCKHEYAVLMAIANKEYEEVKTKPTIKEKEMDIYKIIEIIPAEELKKFILLPNNKYEVDFDEDKFIEYFRSYYPKASYDFYYNNLYNDMVLNKYYQSRIDSYIERAKQYLNGNDFEEVFKIIKSIIEAYKDTDKLNTDNYVFDIIGKLSMLLRITNRKCNEKTKTQIKKWANKLKTDKYYNNYYLEDLIMSLGNE